MKVWFDDCCSALRAVCSEAEYEALKTELTELMSTLIAIDKEFLYRQVKIDKLTFELAKL